MATAKKAKAKAPARRKFPGGLEEMVLLAIHKLGSNSYGVSIALEIQSLTKKRVSTGALYTTLSRLEDKGLISSWVGDATAKRGGRAKRFFKIEASGKEALQSAREARNAFYSSPAFA